MSPASPAQHNIHNELPAVRSDCLNILTRIAIVLFIAGVSGCYDSAGDNSTTNAGATVPTAAANATRPDANGVYHVYEGDSIQAALDAAASDSDHKHVMIHEGTYRPAYPSQAMIRFHSRHDGLFLEGAGQVTLTAENRSAAIPGTAGYPAIVNHVVYFGDGISDKTRIKGLRITGANGFATKAETDGPIEPNSDNPELEKRLFFYLDGGAIKVFGRSSPTIEQIEVFGNQTQLCGAGISIEHRGAGVQPVRIINCVFRDNKCPATGAAIDLLEGSTAIIENCLFVGNIANTGMASVEAQFGLRYNEVHGCGAITVFPGSAAHVFGCTFTQNWNGVDDKGTSSYQDCIFWHNTAGNGSLPGGEYELDVAQSVKVQNCWIHGKTDDLRGTIVPSKNTLQAPDPLFDERFEPRNPQYQGVGYRVNYEKQNRDSSNKDLRP